ncbi:MAG: ribonuclease III [Lentisphaeria bacterium]|jgi:ribonuclease-3|nr:ribonuclease III [Lentisphaeria bacterium]MDP7743245.1 ribonuclease III [Lentisphaeria bacterium]
MPINDLQIAIQYEFRDSALQLEALTHPSFRAEYPNTPADNQRLEFLGDAVIQIIVTDRLYQALPLEPEGTLTKIRAALSKQPTLAGLARLIDLGKHLRLGHGEKQNHGDERDSILCDAFEALIGAMYLDSDNNPEVPSRLLNELIDRYCDDVHQLLQGENPKGELQEWTQRKLHLKPVYELKDVSGPDHERIHTIKVMIGDHCYGEGRAGKRQTAEENAARAALAAIREGSGSENEVNAAE